MNRDLSQFNAGTPPYSKLRLAVWWIIQNTVFVSYLTPNSLKVKLLKIFGSSLGKGVTIRRGVRVHFPWNLKIGNQSWIGEQVWFINHELIEIGSNVCISQSAILCSGSHDYLSVSLNYKHKPIIVKDGAWLCLRSNILAGVTVGECAVVSAGETLRISIPDFSIFADGTFTQISRPT